MTGGRTIFALASGRPPCAVSIIRISGPSAGAALAALCGSLPAPRRAVVRSVRAPDGELLDRALVLWFPGPGTATGEDCAELQLHGSIAVVRGVEAALGRLPDLRPAKAGEFSRRALINGRIDLVQAEALADLMAAETEMQRRAALALAEGGLSQPARQWRAALLRLSAEVEAILDFEDEADVGALASGRAQRAEQAGQLFKEINTILAAPAASRLREGICVVFAGPPNAGKSTLVNALAGREVALVSDEPGTTRDLIEVPVSMHGIAWLLTDSAGLREEGAGAVEQMGIARARAAVAGSDILVWLGPNEASPAHPRLLSIEARGDAPDRLRKPGTLQVSARTGEGLDDLWQALAGHAATLLPRDDQVALNARMRGLLEDCAGAVASAAREPDPVIEAEYLRTARSALDALLGNTGTEAMLDALFGSFCIGK